VSRVSVAASQRVLSGMRPTGQLHLGHYHGVLKTGQNYNMSMTVSFLLQIGTL